MGFRRDAKIDGNQNLIIEFLQVHGAKIIRTAQLKNAFDLLVLHNGRTFIVEIKQPKGKMTEGELKCKALVESVGCKYWVIRDTDSALEMLNS